MAKTMPSGRSRISYLVADYCRLRAFPHAISEQCLMAQPRSAEHASHMRLWLWGLYTFEISIHYL